MVNRRTVLITGATGGIGFELLKLFAREDVALIGTGSRAMADLPVGWPASAIFCQADLSQTASVAMLKHCVAELGWDGIDHLVLNAGTGWAGDPSVETPASICATLTVNLLVPMLTVQAFAGLLAANTGLVTLIGSTAAKGAPGFASYAASKAGLAGFSRALASEWQGRIDVQIIHPGPTATQMHAKAGHDPGFARRFFVHPKDSALAIMRHMQTRRHQAKAGIGLKQIFDGLTGRAQ